MRCHAFSVRACAPAARRLRAVALAAAAALPAAALAQGEGMAGGTSPAGLAAGLPGADASAAGVATRALPPLRVSTSVSASATFTDNADLSTTGRRAELILQAGPSISVAGQQGGLRGSLNYGLQGVAYVRGTEDATLQHRLAAQLSAEPIPERLRIDATAGISQELLSAFGVRSSDPTLGRGNSTQVATVSVSPSLRGSLAGLATYELRLAHAQTHPDEGASSSSSSVSMALGPADAGRLGWSAVASSTQGDDEGGRGSRTDALTLGLSYAVLPELRLSATAGRERQDVVLADFETGTTWSLGLAWSPTPRTTINATRADRFFGNADSLTVTHRFARTVFSYSDSRSIGETGGSGVAVLTLGELLERQLREQIPDDVVRAREITRLLAGTDPRTPAALYGFRFGATSLTRSQQLVMAWTGLRTSAAVTASRSQTRRLDSFSSALDDLVGGNVVTQTGVSATVSRKLTPTSSLSLGYAHARSTGSAAGLRTDLDTLTASWSVQLARRLSMSVSARHAEFDSATQPYDENAVTVSASLQF